MNEPGGHYTKKNKLVTKTNNIWFQLYETHEIVKSTETESTIVVAKVGSTDRVWCLMDIKFQFYRMKKNPGIIGPAL